MNGSNLKAIETVNADGLVRRTVRPLSEIEANAHRMADILSREYPKWTGEARLGAVMGIDGESVSEAGQWLKDAGFLQRQEMGDEGVCYRAKRRRVRGVMP
jgi:hypothetical protein